MDNIIDGKKYRDKLLEESKKIIENNNFDIRLDIIMIGHENASKIYVNNKLKYCKMVGIKTKLHLLDDKVCEDDVINLIKKLNNNKKVTGIILQSPVPKNIDFDKCASHIKSYKDIDGFTKENVFNLYLNKKSLMPCTVKGIIKILHEYNIELEGKNVCIIGRSAIVGKPLALALLNENATVTICHSKTKNLKKIIDPNWMNSKK